ncbi:helix-turn-helix domain-containing protein [Echinicola sp. 20G]|uniref:helix-turn-helix domain-containing protein n=1 Tax=Echinicola sp. 20G TaxID=2781961 RepID=UPI00191001A1|nr:helix-turn-helix domain-containing protein [Echinicola sp. 20G]
MRQLPVQKLLKEEYAKILPLHQHLTDYSDILHRHDHYEFILCSAGLGKHSIDFKTLEIKPHRLYFVRKGQVHIIEKFERDGWLILFGEELFNRFLKIHPKEALNGILNPFSSFPYIDLEESLLRIFDLLIEQLKTELAKEKQDFDIILHYVSIALLYANRAQIVQHPSESLDITNRKLFGELKQLIEEKYKEQHLASYYAKALNSDIKKINRICRDAAGTTLFGLLQERLITECKIELYLSSKTIKEISYEMGFNDPAFFGRFFKRHTGYTPLQFRNKRIF